MCPVTTLEPSAIFADRYKILSTIGQGGMGTVYRAEHLGLGKIVALKVLGVGNDDFAARFEREARAIARLDHPGCIRVLDYGTHASGAQYIAMELLDGPTLASALGNGPLSEQRTLHVGKSLLSALAHAHANGVIHRDVKPENVMFAVASGFRVVLIDFGLASLSDAPALTGAGMCLGSPSYVAPERLLGHPHDARADLYAVGVLLYEMLAGVRPFVGATPQEVMRRALDRPARPLRAIRPDISPSLEAVVRRALAKDPAKRFADAEEMLGALSDVTFADAALAAGEDPDEAGATTAMAQFTAYRAPWWSRAWSYLRYGGWRWRPTEASVPVTIDPR